MTANRTRKTTTAKARMTPAKTATGHKVGDTITVDPAAAMVRLPDGTVVTCRGSYTPTVAGDYVFFTNATAEDGTVRIEETTVAVADDDKAES